MALGYSALLASSNGALTGCQEPERPPAQSFDEPRVNPQVDPSTAPVPAARKEVPRDSLERYCSEGLVPGESPELDVQRLGVVCGAPTGLEPLTKATTHALAAPDSIAAARLEPGECVRAVAASSSDEVVDLEWKTGDDDVLAHCRLKRMGLCPEEGALCPDAASGPASFELVLSSPLDLKVAVRIWRRKSP